MNEFEISEGYQAAYVWPVMIPAGDVVKAYVESGVQYRKQTYFSTPERGEFRGVKIEGKAWLAECSGCALGVLGCWLQMQGDKFVADDWALNYGPSRAMELIGEKYMSKLKPEARRAFFGGFTCGFDDRTVNVEHELFHEYETSERRAVYAFGMMNGAIVRHAVLRAVEKGEIRAYGVKSAVSAGL